MKSRLYVLLVLLVLVIVGFYFYNFHRKIDLTKTISSKPPVVSDDVTKDYTFGDLLGRAEISFAGSTEGREKNIEIGVSRINGKVIMPGEEFSFTKALGPVTEEDGFSQERVFLNGEVTKGLGGGLCQVSTALFQSVLKAGLPVSERWNHSYSVVLYDVGLDATYSDPGPDLKFVNNMSNPITIKGRSEDKKVVFELYGVRDGRVASTTEPQIKNVVDFPPTKYVATSTRDKSLPECVNTPQIGYTSEIVYGVSYPNGTTTQQLFTSTYKPLQRVCYISF